MLLHTQGFNQRLDNNYTSNVKTRRRPLSAASIARSTDVWKQEPSIPPRYANIEDRSLVSSSDTIHTRPHSARQVRAEQTHGVDDSIQSLRPGVHGIAYRQNGALHSPEATNQPTTNHQPTNYRLTNQPTTLWPPSKSAHNDGHAVTRYFGNVRKACGSNNDYVAKRGLIVGYMQKSGVSTSLDLARVGTLRSMLLAPKPQ